MTVDLLFERNKLAAENVNLRRLLNEVLIHLDERYRGDRDAPGHCHQIPGVWDRGSGEHAGMLCGWCALWHEARAAILEPNVD